MADRSMRYRGSSGAATLGSHNVLVNGAEQALPVAPLHVDADGVAVFHEISGGLAILNRLDRSLFGNATVAMARVLVADRA